MASMWSTSTYKYFRKQTRSQRGLLEPKSPTDSELALYKVSERTRAKFFVTTSLLGTRVNSRSRAICGPRCRAYIIDITGPLKNAFTCWAANTLFSSSALAIVEQTALCLNSSHSSTSNCSAEITLSANPADALQVSLSGACSKPCYLQAKCF